MPTAKSLGGPSIKDDGSEREMIHAERAIVNPRPIRLEGVLAAGTVLAPGTFIERVRMGGVSSLLVQVKASGITLVPTVDVFGMTSQATDDDTDGAERNGRAGTQVPLAAQINELGDFTPAGEEFVEIEVTVPGGGAVTIDWIEVLGQ